MHPTQFSKIYHLLQVGKDVILYAILRLDLPVAKGTVVSTNPSTMIVVVNLVLKRDAFLPRPYAEIETMADAYMMSIAWPYKKVTNYTSLRFFFFNL
jgi:hypothetical protein